VTPASSTPKVLGRPLSVAEQFGDNLARCRKAADLSQDELSVRASLHRTEISQLERGLRLARVDTLVKLARSLEVSADELLVGLAWSPGGTRRGCFIEKPAHDR
jgi:transcriptional regulator with XRE-family HTH domain